VLFKQFDLSFLTHYSVFTPNLRGRTQIFELSERLKGVLHCFYRESAALV